MTEEEIRKRIPELKWVELDDLGYFLSAPTDLHYYYYIEVWEYGQSLIKILFSGEETGEKYLTGRRHPEEAKQYCQKDYEDRLLRTLGFEAENNENGPCI